MSESSWLIDPEGNHKRQNSKNNGVDLGTKLNMLAFGGQVTCFPSWLAHEAATLELLQDCKERVGRIDSLGSTAPEDWLKMRPDIMMMGLTTDDFCDKDSRVMKKCKAHICSMSQKISPQRSDAIPDMTIRTAIHIFHLPNPWIGFLTEIGSLECKFSQLQHNHALMNIVELITRLPECLQAKVLQLALINAADLPSFLLICKATNTMLNASLWRQLYAAQGRHAPDIVELLELERSYFQRGKLKQQDAGIKARTSGTQPAFPRQHLNHIRYLPPSFSGNDRYKKPGRIKILLDLWRAIWHFQPQHLSKQVFAIGRLHLYPFVSFPDVAHLSWPGTQRSLKQSRWVTW